MTDNDNGELIISGDGSTSETAVRFKPCHVNTRVARERQFVNERFGAENSDWHEAMHFTTLDGQSVWVIEDGLGREQTVYFDTSETMYD